MAYNALKLGAVLVVAVLCVVALILDNAARDWAVPVLGILVGYLVGNAEVTARIGTTAPIVSNRDAG